jgi:NADPH2:quinone reductase
MRVVQLSRFGGPEVLEIVEQERPEPGPGQALVRVRAAGINFSDTLMRQNRYAVTPELPAVLGSEVAGTVEALGDGAPDGAPNGIKVGARVVAPLFATGTRQGGYSEFVTIDAGLLVPIPDGLSFPAATALMVQGLTALHLTKQIPPAGKTVLVNAAAGGVGSLLVQLAKRAGATTLIAAASTPRKLEFARALGADARVNYTHPDWVEHVRQATGGRGADIIYESAGGAVTPASLEALAPLGTLVIYGALNIQSFQLGVPELLKLIFRNQSVAGFAVAPLLDLPALRAGLTELFDLAVSGALKVTVGGTYPMERAAEAHRSLEERGTTGKLALVP